MKIHVLFGQRKEEYVGQFAPEAIDAIDEFALDKNPEYKNSSKTRTLNDGPYVSAEWFVVDIGDAAPALRQVLMREWKELTGKVETAKAGNVRELSIKVTPGVRNPSLAEPDF